MTLEDVDEQDDHNDYKHDRDNSGEDELGEIEPGSAVRGALLDHGFLGLRIELSGAFRAILRIVGVLGAARLTGDHNVSSLAPTRLRRRQRHYPT